MTLAPGTVGLYSECRMRYGSGLIEKAVCYIGGIVDDHFTGSSLSLCK